MKVSKAKAKEISGAFKGQLFAVRKIASMGVEVECLFDPFTGAIQIGEGGEWWAGKIKFGKQNILVHPKGAKDEAYKPITIYARHYGDNEIALDIMGGFYSEGTTFVIKMS